MKHWIKKNLRNIIVTAFVVPILLVAFVSISHVTTFYGISNPLSWAIYLSVAIEIAALAALAAVSVRMGKFVYVPFFIVTLIQFVGNLYFSFTYIDETTDAFKEWMNMVGSFFEMMGVDPTDPISHKRILALLSGGLLPIISLTFAHMLVVYSDKIEETKTENINKNKVFSEEELDEVSRIAGRIEAENSEYNKTHNFENLDKIEEFLKNLDEQKFGKKVETPDIKTEIEPLKIEIPINLEDTSSGSQINEIELETFIPEDLVLPQISEIQQQNTDEIIFNETPNNDDIKVDNTPQIKRLVYTGRND